MITLAEVVGERGTMEYTPDHKIILKIPTLEPEAITEKLQAVRLFAFAYWGCVNRESM